MRASSLRAGALLVALAVALGGCARIKRWAYERGDRDEWQQPERVVEMLGLAPGEVVADLGSGGGYFAFRLADAVGEGGRVYAVDVDAAMNDLVEKEAAKRGLPQIETVLAGPDDAKLPEPVTLLFTCNTYHHLSDRTPYFEKIRGSIAPGGRVAVVEFKPGAFRHNTDPALIVEEMEAAGYELAADHDFLERQSFLVFRPRPEGE